MYTVLIVTSGLGSRLGNLTKHLNKALICVGDKFSICYIIDKYDLKNTQFVITLGYHADLVREFLDIAYENNNFIYVYVDNYDKEGSSLVYSLLQAQSVLQCPFMFYCCDSLILDNDILCNNDTKTNIMYVAEHEDTDSYTSILINGNRISKINNKGCKEHAYVYTGVSYIHNFEEYWQSMQTVYENAKYNKQLSDVDVINNMLQNNIIFQYKLVSEWYDIGNINSYNNTLNHLKCSYDILYKDDESLCFLADKVIKFFHDEDKVKKRVFRGKSLYPRCPKIFNYSKHFFSMEYIEGTVLSHSYKSGQIYDLLCWSMRNLWLNQSIKKEYNNLCIDFYKLKTSERLKLLNIEELNVINGINILPLTDLLETIDWQYLATDTFYNFHGDFILDNIIYTGNTYKLLDWRQDFAGNITHGDMYYDLAKLRHNIIFNHKNILNELYTIEIKNNQVIVDLKCNYFLMQQLDDFDKFLSQYNFDKKKVKILTALIWLNMAPLHTSSISKFLFYFGKYNLALALLD